MATASDILIQRPGPLGQDLVRRDTDVLAPVSGRVYPFAMDRGLGCEVWDLSLIHI